MPPSPEFAELEKKRAELDALEQRLAERELELSTLESELAAFHAQCVKRLGPLFARLDELRARLAAARARTRPLDAGAGHEADEAHSRAFDTAQQAAFYAALPDAPDFDPPPDTRQLYREAARRLHPDRAVSDADRQRRTELMARVNRAYRAGDRAGLEALLREAADAPEEVMGEDVAAALIRAIRHIARITRRLEEIDERIAALSASDIHRLMQRVREEAALGRDPFGELAHNLEREIAAARAALAAVEAGPAAEVEAADVPPEASVLAEELCAEPAERRHATPRGEPVRHAAEAAIAAVLHELGLDYRYEQPIVGTLAPGIRRPSFALRDRQGRWLIWQHLPAAADGEAVQRRCAWFERNGYVRGINLFLTEDTPGGAPDPVQVRRIAEYLKAVL